MTMSVTNRSIVPACFSGSLKGVGLSVAGFQNFVAAGLQKLARYFANFLLILCQQNRPRAAWSLRRP